MLVKRSKDSAVTVSVVIVQIFHERENKLRPFTKKKKNVRQRVGVEGFLVGRAAPASSNRDFESLDFLLPTQLNSSHKRSVIFVESLLRADPFPREVCLL